MAEIYDIDIVRAILDFKIADSTIFLASFYEQIQDEQEIARYVDTIKELVALQNQEKDKSLYKAMGIVSQSGSNEILNISSRYVSPLEYMCRFDIELEDRDYVLGKIKDAIALLRGKKFDLAMLTTGTIKVFNNPTIVASATKATISDYCYLGLAPSDPTNASNKSAIFTYLDGLFTYTAGTTYNCYIKFGNNLHTLVFNKTANTLTATSLGAIDELLKVSLSFNGIQSQEPYINNGLDRIWLFFSGSATITDSYVMLGNDIIQTTLKASTSGATEYLVEPMEMPSALAINDDTYQTWTTAYQTIDRNLGISNKVSYSFVYDTSSALMNELYKLARYGSSTLVLNDYFTIKEYRWAFGVLIVDTFYGLIGDCQAQNTNGDVMTLSVAFKVGKYA